jgi:hypothetical protein
MSLWMVERVQFRTRELDFSSAGLANHRTTSVLADGTEIINALDLVEATEDPIQVIICDACGTPGCGGGNRIVVRRFADGIVLLPAFDAMAAGSWELTEYGPPYFVAKHGSAFFRGRALAALEERIPFFADPMRWPALTAREAVLILQWDAPSRVLGTYPEPPRLREDQISAVSHGAGREPYAALELAIARSLADPRPVTPVAGEAVIFYLDQAGFPEWAPLTFDGAEYRLALAAGMGIEPT